MDTPMTRSDGSFQLRVSSYIDVLNIYSTRSVDATYQYASSLVKAGSTEFVELRLQSN
jgi:hypothetical protein